MIYIDSTIHNVWNRRFNAKLTRLLEKKGVNVYLPQRDTIQKKKTIFIQNHKALKKCTKVLAIAVNETPNWGVEIGFSYALGKQIIALCEKKHAVPLMAKSMFSEILFVRDINKIEEFVNELVENLRR